MICFDVTYTITPSPFEFLFTWQKWNLSTSYKRGTTSFSLCLIEFEICSRINFRYNWEEFEDTKGVIRIRKSKKNREHNGQKKIGQNNKQRSSKHTHKTKDRVTRTTLKIRGELWWFRLVNIVTNPVISHEWGKDREVEYIHGHLWHRYSIHRFR